MGEKIVIVLGSKSDLEKLGETIKVLDDFNVGYTSKIISAHRNPEELRKFCKEIEGEGAKVVIACAGLSCALPGFIASYVDIPVIGVPLEGGMLDGLDSLLSIVQVPKGIGLVSSGTGRRGLINAIIFSLEILSLMDKEIHTKLIQLKEKFKN